MTFRVPSETELFPEKAKCQRRKRATHLQEHPKIVKIQNLPPVARRLKMFHKICKGSSLLTCGLQGLMENPIFKGRV